MKYVILLMSFIIVFAVGLSFFGFVPSMSFHKSIEELGDTFVVFDDFFNDALLSTFRVASNLSSGNINGDYYVYNEDLDGALYFPELKDVRYIVKINYKPLKHTANGANVYYIFTETMFDGHPPSHVFLLFDERGNFLNTLFIRKGQHRLRHQYYVGSYFFRSSEMAKVYFTEPPGLVEGAPQYKTHFIIYGKYKGSIIDFTNKYWL